MIEANTIYLWQMPSGIDAMGFCASVPASIFVASGFSTGGQEYNHLSQNRYLHDLAGLAFFSFGKHLLPRFSA